MTDNLPVKAKGTPFARSNEIMPQAGQYWIWNPSEDIESRSLVKGLAYLVKKVHVIDGQIHSLETAAHPSKDRGSLRISIDEFLEQFKYTEQGETIREGEILEVTQTISALQRQLVDHTREAANPAPNENGPKLLSGPTVNDPDTVAALLTSGRSVAEMSQDIETRRQNMLEISERITATTKSIETETKKLARFYQEKAGAALASVDDVLTHADHLKKGITTLGLFAGDGVEVNLIRDGEPAKGEKLTLRQLKLHLDEELVCHIDDEGGADYTAIAKLGDLFDRDPDLLDRMIPERLGIVLLKFRRRDKEYKFSWARGINSDVADMLANIEENTHNREQVLLVRNGEKVWEVRAENALQNIPRLFPRERDLDDVYRERSHVFRGLESSMITPKDLQYVEARGKFEQMALEYRRVLVLLWGLDQRLQLFGHWFDRQKHQTFLTAEFQEECLNFVADEEDVLMEGRPSVHEYIADINSRLEAGSRIIVRWRDLIDMDTCPSMVEVNQRTLNEQLKYNLKQEREIVTVERRGGKLMVPVEACHKWRDTERRFYVDLEKGRTNDGYIVIDEMRTDDIKWYLGNRVARADYLHYVSAFLMAYDVLKEQESLEANAVSDMVERSGGPTKRKYVMRALTHWRNASSEKILPIQDSEALEKDKKAILAHAELLSGAFPGEVTNIMQEIEQEVRPYRIGRTISGQYIAVADCPERPENIPFPWVEEHTFSKKGKLLRSRFHLAGLERTDLAQLKNGTSIPQAEEIASLRRPYGEQEEDPASVIAALRAIKKPEDTHAWRMIMEPDSMIEESSTYFKLSRKPKGRNEPVHCDLPLAVVEGKGYPKILYLSVRPIGAMEMIGGEAKKRIHKFYDTYFAYPKRALENLHARGAVGFNVSATFNNINLDLALGTGAHVHRPEYVIGDSQILEKSPYYEKVISRLEELNWLSSEEGKKNA